MNPLARPQNLHQFARERALKLGTNETLVWEAIRKGPKSSTEATNNSSNSYSEAKRN
jgi:hypothetical protein